MDPVVYVSGLRFDSARELLDRLHAVWRELPDDVHRSAPDQEVAEIGRFVAGFAGAVLGGIEVYAQNVRSVVYAWTFSHLASPIGAFRG